WRAIGGAVFSDTGNVFARVRDIKPANLTENVGFGLRIKTPIGPLRFDLGFLVFNKPPSQRDYRFHASFGQTF
ncbi:MAG TPA: BamA/TamA family outer membrane protein, partial [Blastocatellia bacterium]|nr:BamA/TamA family outer membrane protein [Blastocatellia bacterium]